MSSAVQNALHAATAAVSLAAMRLRSKFGIAIAAMMAIMATTIINSISVNPLLFIFSLPIGLPSSGLRQRGFGCFGSELSESVGHGGQKAMARPIGIPRKKNRNVHSK